MATTNKLLQTALWKQMHSSRQPEAAIITYHHTVERAWDYIDPAIIT